MTLKITLSVLLRRLAAQLVPPEIRILVQRPRQARVKRRLLQGPHPLRCGGQIWRVPPEGARDLAVPVRRCLWELELHAAGYSTATVARSQWKHAK